MTNPIGTIEVQQNVNGFTVYGRMGAVLKADKEKNVTYSNLNSDAAEYKRMIKHLKNA